MEWYGAAILGDPNMYFTGQCHVLNVLYLFNSDNYVVVIKGVIYACKLMYQAVNFCQVIFV